MERVNRILRLITRTVVIAGVSTAVGLAVWATGVSEVFSMIVGGLVGLWVSSSLWFSLDI